MEEAVAKEGTQKGEKKNGERFGVYLSLAAVCSRAGF